MSYLYFPLKSVVQMNITMPCPKNELKTTVELIYMNYIIYCLNLILDSIVVRIHTMLSSHSGLLATSVSLQTNTETEIKLNKR